VQTADDFDFAFDDDPQPRARRRFVKQARAAS
jgi:hypothetical protein